MYDVVVIGSINIDHVMFCPYRPAAGEAVTASGYFVAHGGKGGTQAVTAARCGARTLMVGAVGNDSGGQLARDNLMRRGVDARGVVGVDEPTGTALISIVDGDNAIVIYQGANALVTLERIAPYERDIAEASVALMQMEIPYETVRYIAELRRGKTTILNPAPNAHLLPRSDVELYTYITPNTQEYGLIYGDIPLEQSLIGDERRLIVTRGAQGAYYAEGGNVVHIPAVPVTPVDTTGAGDNFNGALAAALSKGRTLHEALTHANAVASQSTLYKGGQW